MAQEDGHNLMYGSTSQDGFYYTRLLKDFLQLPGHHAWKQRIMESLGSKKIINKMFQVLIPHSLWGQIYPSREEIFELFHNLEGKSLSMVVDKQGELVVTTNSHQDGLSYNLDAGQIVREFVAFESLHSFLDAHDKMIAYNHMQPTKLQVVNNLYVLCRMSFSPRLKESDYRHSLKEAESIFPLAHHTLRRLVNNILESIGLTSSQKMTIIARQLSSIMYIFYEAVSKHPEHYSSIVEFMINYYADQPHYETTEDFELSLAYYIDSLDTPDSGNLLI